MDWNYAARDNLFLRDELFEIPEYVRNGREPVQIISSGPDSKSEEIRDNYMRLIHKARHHIYLQTPYFVPDDCNFGSASDCGEIGSRCANHDSV